jgi:DNA-directed RNA polymerase
MNVRAYACVCAELDEALRARYAEEQVANLPELPPYGDLDLSRVRESDYFFS